MSRSVTPEVDQLLHEMIAPAATGLAERARRRRLAASAATVGLALVGMGSLSTSALFTDHDDIAGGEFTTGTIKVGLKPSSTFLRLEGMIPGDVSYGSLAVVNDGSLGYRYAVEKSAVDAVAPLSGQLLLTAFAVPDAASCTAEGVAGREPVRPTATLAADGSVLIGDRTTGGQPGDRLVVASGSEVLCFEVALPLETTDAFQGASTTVSLTVYAEQSAHND